MTAGGALCEFSMPMLEMFGCGCVAGWVGVCAEVSMMLGMLVMLGTSVVGDIGDAGQFKGHLWRCSLESCGRGEAV